MKYFELQKAAGLSNAQAARFLGVGISTVKRWRNGTNEAPLAVVLCLRSVVDGVSVDKLEVDSEYPQL